jgi:hypothetical protein
VVEREVVAALAVFGLVIDGAAGDFDLAGAEITLEVGLIVVGVPQTELDEREQLQLLRFVALVAQGDLVDLARLAGRDEVQRLGLDAAA